MIPFNAGVSLVSGRDQEKLLVTSSIVLWLEP